MSEAVNYGTLSFQQKQSYDYHMSLTDAGSYEIMLLDLDVSSLNPHYLSRTINKLYKDNDSLRTVFIETGGVVSQHVLNFEEQDNCYFDILDQAEVLYEEVQIDQLLSVTGRTMGLAGSSLLCKCKVVTFKQGMVRCVFFVHHIIADLWSVLILKRKFYQLYDSLVTNPFPAEQPVKTSYNMIDYAKEQQEAFLINGASYISYWQNKLAPTYLNLKSSFIDITGTREEKFNHENPADTISEKLNTGACGFMVVKLSHEKMASVYQVLKMSNTGFMALFNVIFSLLPLYHGADQRVLIASPVNNRLNSRLKSVIGLCGGSIYTYLSINPDLTVSQVLKAAYLDILKSFKYAITDHGVFKLDGHHLREKSGLFLNITSKEFENKIPAHYYTTETFEGKRIYYALQCSIHEQEDHISMIWAYNKNFYTQEQVTRLLESVFNLIDFFELNMDKPVRNAYDLINSV